MSEEHYTYFFIGDEVTFRSKLKKSVQDGKAVYAVFPGMGWEEYDFLVKLNEKKLNMILDNEDFFWCCNVDVHYILSDQSMLARQDFPLELNGYDGKKMFCFECDDKSGEMSDKDFKEWLEKLIEELNSK